MEREQTPAENRLVGLAENLRKLRDKKGLSLDEVASKATISKAYLWELERDREGHKKPSAAVLMKIAAALSTTLAELLNLPTVQAPQGPVELTPSLKQFRDRLQTQGQQLSDDDVRDLAGMRFRGTQPQTPDEWHQLYLILLATTRRLKE